MASRNTLLLLFLILVIAMIALVFHLSAQRPEAPELVATTPTSDPAAPVAARTIPVTLYAYDARLDTDTTGNVLCSAKGLVPVGRVIPETDAPMRAALELLLRDPLTSDERARGLSTEFPLQGVTIEDVNISGDTATIEIADPDNKLSGGSCRVSVLRARLEATAKQFKDITDVRFLPEDVLEP